MNKISFLLVSFVLLSSAQEQARFTVPVKYDSKWLMVENGYTKFSIRTGTTPCQPALPNYKLTFLLPPDADLNTVSISVSDMVTKVLDREYVVPPVPPLYRRINDQTIAAWPPELTIENGKDMGIYEKNAFFPADPIGEPTVGLGRQYKLANVVIFPYCYNPISKKLRAIVSGRVLIHFATTPGAVPTIPRSSWYEDDLKDYIDNDTSIFKLYDPVTAIKTIGNGTIRKNNEEISMVLSKDQFRIPEAYRGVTSSVSAYNFMGKRLFTVTTKNPAISIKERKELLSGNTIIKIKPLQ